MKKRAVLVSLFSSILIPSVYAANTDGSIVSGFNMTFGWVNDFLNSKTAVFGLMVLLLFFLLYGIIITALKKTPLFGGKELDRAGKVVALSFSGIVVLSVFFVRNNAMEFAKTLAGAMNGFFALLLSGLVFLALKFTFKSETQGELGGVKWENIIGFLGFILSLRMFAALMDSGPLKTVSVSLSYLSIIGMFVYVLLKNRDLNKNPEKDIAHQQDREKPVIKDLNQAVSEVRQDETKLAADDQRILNAVAEAVKARPEKREGVLKEAEGAVKKEKKDVVQTESQMRRVEKDVAGLLRDNQKIIEDKKRIGPPDPAEMKKLQEQADRLKDSVNLAKKAEQDLERERNIDKEIVKLFGFLNGEQKMIMRSETVANPTLLEQHERNFESIKNKIIGLAKQKASGLESIERDVYQIRAVINQYIAEEQKRLREQPSWATEALDMNIKLALKGVGQQSGQSLIHLNQTSFQHYKVVVEKLVRKRATVEYDIGDGLRLARIVGVNPEAKDVLLVGTEKNPQYPIYFKDPKKYRVFKINVH